MEYKAGNHPQSLTVSIQDNDLGFSLTTSSPKSASVILPAHALPTPGWQHKIIPLIISYGSFAIITLQSLKYWLSLYPLLRTVYSNLENMDFLLKVAVFCAVKHGVNG